MPKKTSYDLTPEEIKEADELRESMRAIMQQRMNLTLAEANHIRQNRRFWTNVGLRLKVDFCSRDARIKSGRIVQDD